MFASLFVAPGALLAVKYALNGVKWALMVNNVL